MKLEINLSLDTEKQEDKELLLALKEMLEQLDDEKYFDDEETA